MEEQAKPKEDTGAKPKEAIASAAASGENGNTVANEEGEAKPAGEESKAPDGDSTARYAALRNHRIRFEDAIDPNAERVQDLKKEDIVFGRGRGFQNHPGNLRMRSVIEKYKRHYHSLKRSDKRILVENVYKELIKDGARFLKKLDDEEGWVKVDVPIALQKVSHTLRCRKSVEKLGISGSETSGVSAGLPHFDHGISPLPQTTLQSLAQNQALQLGMLPSYAPLLGTEAMQLAALNRQRALGLMPMMPSMPLGNDYLSLLRRDQLIRETMLLQQMTDGGGRMAVPGGEVTDPPMGGQTTAALATDLNDISGDK